MSKEMLINVSEGEECRIALVEDGRLEELYIERTSSTSHVGNIYKGKVTNVEASIQAAFIDFGLGRNGFLHVSDLLPEYFGKKGEDVEEYVGKKMARRDRPPIQRCLRRGDEITVQVIKEGIGTKGPTLSSYLSVSGKMLVMMPGVSGRGVSRKIEDDQERRRLKQILDALDPPEDCGFIIRTEAVGKSRADIERDLKYLARLWEQMKKKRDASNGPTELYTEGDLVTRTIRDVFNTDVDRVIVDSPDVADRVRDVVRLTSPKAKDKVEVHDNPIPLLHKYGIERDIELMYSRHVPLPSGGSLVIDSTEAIVAIDVNSGKFRDHSDAETTAFKTDMEAADEICRQLKLRDLGGVIICDFIDLRFERHRRELEQRIVDNFKKDRAKTKVLRMSQFGIIEITRQRMRPSLKRSVYFDCPHCKGAGLVKTPESMSLDVMRRLAIAMNDLKVARAELAVCGDVAVYLNNKKRRSLADLEDRTKKRVVVKTDPTLGLDEMRLDLYDNRDGMVLLPELSEVLTSHPHTSQLHTRPAGKHGAPQGQNGGRGDARRGGRSQEQRRQERERELADDRLEFDDEEREQQGEPRRDDRSRDSRGSRDDRSGRDRGEQRRDDRGEQRRDDRGSRRDDRGEQRDDRGDRRNDRGDRSDRGNRSERNDRGDNRGERRDDRGERRDDRGQRRDDRGEPRRDDRGEQRDNRGDRRDDRGEPRRDDRGERRDGGRREDRGQRDAQRGGRDDRSAQGDHRDTPRDGGRDRQRERQPVPSNVDDQYADRGDDQDYEDTESGQAEHDESSLPTSDTGASGDRDQENGGNGGRRRRRRRRRGRGRGQGGQREGGSEPLTAFGDYPEDEAASDRAEPAGRDDRADGDRRDERDDRDNRGRDRRGDYAEAPAAQADDETANDDAELEPKDVEDLEDDLGPAPEPVESGYQEEYDYGDDADEPEAAAEADEDSEEAPAVAAESPAVEALVEPERTPMLIEPEADEADEAEAEPVTAEESPAAEPEKPKRRGGSRAKAPAAKKTSTRAAKAPAAKAAPKASTAKGKKSAGSTTSGSRKRTSKKSEADAPADTPRARIAEAAPAPVARRRAADKHLVADTEVEAESDATPEVEAEPITDVPLPTPRRSSSRSYRDLDAIPDDYD